MLNKINKLIHAARDESAEVQDRLIAIAQKVRDNAMSGKTYLLIDIKEMESLVSSEKVEIQDNVGKIEVDV